MAVVAKSNGNAIPQIEAGVYTAICYAVIDLGIQYVEMFKSSMPKVMLCWELPEETFIDSKDNVGKPRGISKEYTLSLNEKANLRKDLESWRGKAFTEEELKGFDLANILGAGCQLSVIHNDKGYAKIAAIMALGKKAKVGEPFNKPYIFDLIDPEKVKQQLPNIPEWIQKKIKDSETYKAMFPENGQPFPSDSSELPIDDEDQLPF